MRLTEQQITDIRRLIEDEKLAQHKAARIMGLSENTIMRACKEFKIKTQRRGPRSGPGHPDWKGGRTIDKSGYVLVYSMDHPYRKVKNKGARTDCGGYVREHRLVMEKILGRFLLPTEVVDHINGIKDDNRPENLRLYSSNADHLRATLAGKCPQWTKEGIANIAAGRGWSDETVRRLQAAAPQ